MLCAALWLFSTSAVFCANKSYLDYVSDGLDALEQGRTAASVDCLKQALACNANDPLAHTVLGLSLLAGQRPKDAAAEFGVALSLDKQCAQAHYGIGITCLLNKEFGPAKAAFEQAKARGASLDIGDEIAYMDAVQRGSYNYSEPSRSRIALAMNAISLMSNGRHLEALKIWQGLQQKEATANYREHAGAAVSFLRSAPVAVNGTPIKTYARTASVKKSGTIVVHGTIALKADLSKARSVRLVLFFVDNKLVGITNKSPFQYPWNTMEVANGPHTLKIQGTDGDGLALTEKIAEVVVKNEGGTAPSAKVNGEQADKAWARLWRLLQIRPSQAAINYNLSACAMECKEKDAAEAALERVIAANPHYLDAGDRLASIYGPSSLPQNLYKVQTNQKLIALTFDDGPKEYTALLLDALRSKGVKATFFVVGKQTVAFPKMFAQMLSDGHEIANHTYNHNDLEYLSDTDIRQEIFSNTAIIRAATGKRPKFIRPPGAHSGKRLPGILSQFHMTCVYWTANCGKFEGTTKEKMQNYVLSTAKPGAIILMHNMEGVTLRALPGIIDTLTARGYRFVTLSELTAGR